MLVGLGLIDETSTRRRSGIRQLMKGPKEIVILPKANHQGDTPGNTHAAYLKPAPSGSQPCEKASPSRCSQIRKITRLRTHKNC